MLVPGALLLAFRAAAQTPNSLTLQQAQRLALERNADLRVAEASVRAAIAQVRIAQQFPNPTFGFSVARINTDGSGNGTVLGNRILERSYDSIVSLGQLFELGGKRALRRESSLTGRKAAEAQRDDVRRLLLQSVTQAYMAAIEAGEEVRVLTDSTASLRREAEVASTRLSVGDISVADKAQIEIAAERFALDAQTARHTALAAAITLEALLGQPTPGGNTQFADTLATLAEPRSDDFAPEALAVPRPDIAAAEASLVKANIDLKLQQRGRVPDVTLVAQFEHNPPDSRNSAGFGFSLPLPAWNFSVGEIQAARAARDQAEAQLDKARLQASAEIATARSALRDAQSRAQTFITQLLPKSADVVRTVTFSYEKGGASLLDLLSAQRNDNDLRIAAARAQADYVNARVALAAALNRLTPPAQP